MNTSRIIRTVASFGMTFATLATVAFSSSAHAESSIDARYRSERAVCMSGQSNQDRATCLKEASAARAEAKRNRLDTGSASLEQNARARCVALPADDRTDCERRMRGEGTVSGSERNGGVLREITTVVPAK